MSGTADRGTTVTVRYFGLIRNTLDVAEEQVQVPEGATVKELLEVLAQRHGDAFREVVLATGGRLLPNATIVLDGADISHREGMGTRVTASEATCILVMPPFAGGG